MVERCKDIDQLLFQLKMGGGVKKKNHLVLIKSVNYDVKRIL